MESTSNLSLPYLIAGQGLKNITHNEALKRLDNVLLIKAAADRNTPEETDPDGATIRIGLSPRLEFSDKAGWLAKKNGSEYEYIAPPQGALCWIESLQRLDVYAGNQWRSTQDYHPSVGSLAIGTTLSSQDTNRLSVKTPNALFTAEESDIRLMLNKSNPSDIASLIFQTEFSGRAEFSLDTTDTLVARTSANGETWETAISVEHEKPVTCSNGLRSQTFVIAQDEVIRLTPPSSGGLIAIATNHPDFPRASHSGFVAYDIGPTPQAVRIAGGSLLDTASGEALNGTSGDANKTTISAVTGEILIENRSTTSRHYSLTYLCG